MDGVKIDDINFSSIGEVGQGNPRLTESYVE